MVVGRPGYKPVWSPHLEQLCVWQTFALLTTHRQDPSCSTGACQLSTQMGLWESQAGVYQSLDVTPLFQTSMPPLWQRASPQRCSIWEVGLLRSAGTEFRLPRGALLTWIKRLDDAGWLLPCFYNGQQQLSALKRPIICHCIVYYYSYNFPDLILSHIQGHDTFCRWMH